MKETAVFRAVILFGLINLIDVADQYGWQDVNGGLRGVAFSIWVSVRNFVGFTLLPVAAAWLLGRRARPLLAVGFAYAAVAEIACLVAVRVFHTDLAGCWLRLVLDFNPTDWQRFLALFDWWRAGAVAAVSLAVVAVGVRWLWRADYPAVAWRRGILALVPFAFFNLNSSVGLLADADFAA